MITLNRIKIKQFRAYEDVDIHLKTKNGVILMSGDNGSGKSTLLNAICWCLYADTPFYAIGESKEILNMHAPQDSKIEVELEATINEKTYIYKRVGTEQSIGGELTVSYEENGNWQIYDAASNKDAVRQLLPKDIRHLFIFNGEQIAGIFKPNSDKGLRDSVYKISEIDILDRTKKHLEEVQNEYLHEIEKQNKNSKNIDTLKLRRIDLSSKILKDEEAQKILKIKIADKNEQLNKLDEVIRATAGSREMLKRRDVLEDQLKSINEELDKLEADKLEIFQNNYHKALLHSDFAGYVEALEKAEEEDMIPPPIKPEVTSRILKTKTCICGRHIDEDQASFILKQHQENEAKEELRYLTEGVYLFEKSSEDLEDANYLLKDVSKEIQDNQQGKQRIQGELRKINDTLDDANLEHDNPDARRNDLKDEIDRHSRSIGSFDRQVEIDKQELRRVNELLDKTIAKDDATASLDRKRLFTLKLVDYIEDIKAEMEELVRDKMQKSVSEMFFAIMSNTVFSEIQIDSNYTVSLISSDGKKYHTNQLSTGQAKTLGLSLAYSLSKDVGYESSPMLIDNLYGDIKDSRFKELTKMVEVLATKKQVFIMDLNAEKSRPMFSEGSIAQEFNIIRLEREKKTVVKEAGE